MKKFMAVILMINLLAAHMVAYAVEFDFNLSYDRFQFEKQIEIPVSESWTQSYPPSPVWAFEVNGKLYQKNSYTGEMIPINIDAYTAITNKTNMSGWEVVEGDSIYIARDTTKDGAPTDVLNVIQIKPLYVFDNDFNVIKEVGFKGIGMVNAVDYYNGVYYCMYSQKCRVIRNEKGDFVSWGEPVDDITISRHSGLTGLRSVVVMSTDLENWTEIEKMPRHNGNVNWQDGQIDIAKQGMVKVLYEDSFPEYNRGFGEWFAFECGEKSLYLSNDNVYFVKIHAPVSEEHKDLSIKNIYEVDGNIVVTSNYSDGVQFITPAQPIYDELNRLKNAPYISLNGTVLAFEEAPVIEDDRTFVPMRFLFEQMGAEVGWDEATETATVAKNGETISFQINSVSAKVNSNTKLMDVPAKLINDKTMVPLRFLSENLGYNVAWDEATKMVTITTE